MSNFNLIVVEGRLTRDSELIHTSKGNPLLKFSIANNYIKRYKNEKREEVSFFNVIAWNSLAEIMSRYLKKGTHIIVSGRIQIENYVNKEGQKSIYTKIIANNIDFVSKGKTAESTKKSA